MDNKIHIHFCTDLKKPLEIINLEYTFSLANNKITYIYLIATIWNFLINQ